MKDRFLGATVVRVFDNRQQRQSDVFDCGLWLRRDSVAADTHELPGFAIQFKRRLLGVGLNTPSLAIFNNRDREDIPDVLRENVGDEEVNFVGCIWELEPTYGFHAMRPGTT